MNTLVAWTLGAMMGVAAVFGSGIIVGVVLEKDQEKIERAASKATTDGQALRIGELARENESLKESNAKLLGEKGAVSVIQELQIRVITALAEEKANERYQKEIFKRALERRGERGTPMFDTPNELKASIAH